MALSDPVYRLSSTSNVVYLTFDDGPYVTGDTVGTNPRAEATTDDLILKLNSLRTSLGDPALSATFFINGWGLERDTPYGSLSNSQLVLDRRQVCHSILFHGHDIANHTYHHANPWGKKVRIPGTSNYQGTDTIEAMKEEIRLSRLAMQAHIRHPTLSSAGVLQPYLRAPGDPSYFPVGSEKRGKNVPAGRIWNGTADEPAKARFRKIVTAANLTDLTYVTFNIWTKDNEPGLPTDWVYWHAINARSYNYQATGRPFDPDRLSFALLPTADRQGGIILMHAGRQASVDALGAFGALPGIIPYLYAQNYVVRKLPPPPLTPG